MSSRPSLLLLSGYVCDARPWRRERVASLFSLFNCQQFLLRGAGQLAGTIHG